MEVKSWYELMPEEKTMRYQQLINQAIDDGKSLRELANAMGVSASALHNYAYTSVEPRLEALKRMSAYFGEPLATLLSEDDDLTARLITLVRHLPESKKQEMLQTLEGENEIYGPYTVHNPTPHKQKGIAR